jgi:dihydrofolate reductase
LVDEMHVAVVPILLGRGERLFDHLDGGPHGYECIEFVSSPAVAHARLTRR